MKKEGMTMVSIHLDKCTGCGLCVGDCLAQAIAVGGDGKAEFTGDCFECGHCVAICPCHTVEIAGYNQDPPLEIVPGEHTAPDPGQLMKWHEKVITALILGYPAVNYRRTAPRRPLKLTRL